MPKGASARCCSTWTRDPDELTDLGESSEHEKVIEMMYERLGRWARRMSQRTTRSEDDILAMRGKSRRKGVLLGVFDGSEVDDELMEKYRGKADHHTPGGDPA